MREISITDSLKILKVLCAKVGQDSKRLETMGFFKKKNWFWEYTWTREEEDGFRDWLAQFLYKQGYADKRKHRGIPRNIHEANKFIANYGWVLKN